MALADDIYDFHHHASVSNSQVPSEIAGYSQQRKCLQQRVPADGNETADGYSMPLNGQHLALRWSILAKRRARHLHQAEQTLQLYS